MSPDDTRAQAAGACDAAAIGARLHAIDREGVRSIDDALVMGAAITDPSTGDVEWILRHAPDVIDCLADAVRRFTAAAAADAFADRVRACHAAAARVERYTLPAEVLALIADVPVLLDALAREREGHAAEVAAAVDDAVRRERDMWQAQIETTTTDAADALDMIDDLVRHAVLHHPLPWRIEDDWTREVTAADGTIIAKCMTHARAAAIIAAAEKIRAALDAPLCDICGQPATCRGEYEGEAGQGCDECCGHSNEGGHCEPIGDAPAQGGG